MFKISQLSSFTNLTNLDFRGFMLSENQAIVLMNLLHNNEIVTRVNLSRCNWSFGPEFSDTVGNMLSNNNTLKVLNLNHIISDMTDVFIEGVKNNSSLVELCLYEANIGNEKAEFLSLVLQNNTTLKFLDIRRNDMNSIGLGFFSDLLLLNTKIEYILVEDDIRDGMFLWYFLSRLRDRRIERRKAERLNLTLGLAHSEVYIPYSIREDFDEFLNQ